MRAASVLVQNTWLMLLVLMQFGLTAPGQDLIRLQMQNHFACALIILVHCGRRNTTEVLLCTCSHATVNLTCRYPAHTAYFWHLRTAKSKLRRTQAPLTAKQQETKACVCSRLDCPGNKT